MKENNCNICNEQLNLDEEELCNNCDLANQEQMVEDRGNEN